MYFWIIMIVILTIIEIASINLTTIWFVASALVSLCISFLTDNFLLQFGIFVILGIILLITTKPLLVKLLKVDNVKTNLDRVIGMNGIVTEEILPDEVGEVKVDGKRWSAFSDEEIPLGTKVNVLEINGVKLKVKKVED